LQLLLSRGTMLGMAAAREYQNVYGRRFGRGLRPWLLIPKYVCVAVFLGGLVSLLVLGFARPAPADGNEWAADAQIIRQAYPRVIVPALIGALILGVLLALAHPTIFLRMRWLQVKLALILVFVPTLHFFMSRRSVGLRDAVARQDFATAGLLREQLFRGTLAAAAFALLVILLGRLKPRLGRDYGRTFGRRTRSEG
jgi:uncharacterized membrane protein